MYLQTSELQIYHGNFTKKKSCVLDMLIVKMWDIQMRIPDTQLNMSSLENWNYQFEIVIIKIIKFTGIDEFMRRKGKEKEEDPKLSLLKS